MEWQKRKNVRACAMSMRKKRQEAAVRAGCSGKLQRGTTV